MNEVVKYYVRSFSGYAIYWPDYVVVGQINAKLAGQESPEYAAFEQKVF